MSSLRTLLATAAGAAILAVFSVSQMRFFEVVFDYYFGLVPLAAVMLGVCLGVGFAQWRKSAESAEQQTDSGAYWVASSAVAGAGCMVVVQSLPYGYVLSFLFVVAAVAAPFLCWSYGIRLLDRAGGISRLSLNTAWLLGLVAGLLGSPVVLSVGAGPVSVGWFAVTALATTGLIVTTKRSAFFASGAALLVSGLTAYQLSALESGLPQWAPGARLLTKPTLREVSTGHPEARVRTSWGFSARTDLVVPRSAGTQEFGWILTNGTAPVPVAAGVQAKPFAWWKKRFPSLALPLMLQEPIRVLSVGAVAGPEILMAKALDAPTAKSIPYNHTLTRHAGDAADQGPGRVTPRLAELTFVNIRTVLERDNQLYDLVFLPLTHPSNFGWIGSNYGDTYLYTEDAFGLYLSRLQEHGFLIVAAREEDLFVRALFTVWGVLAKESLLALPQRAWGVRTSGGSPFSTGYRYLLIVSKGRISSDQSANFQKLIAELPLAPLFGPDIDAEKPYDALNHLYGMTYARAELTRFFSRRVRVLLDLEPVSDKRPFFFQIRRDLHPFLKWLFTSCLLVVLACLLLPLPSLRRVDAGLTGRYPPIPVILGYFVAAGGCLSLAAGEAARRLMLVSNFPLLASLAALVAIVTGFGAGAALGKDLASRWVNALLWAPLSGLAAVGLLYWGSVAGLGSVAVEFSSGKILVLLCAYAFLAATLAIALHWGMDQLSEQPDLAGLRPWAWVVFGVSTLGGVVLDHWLAQLWGPEVVWSVMAGCFLLVLGIGLWMRGALAARCQPLTG